MGVGTGGQQPVVSQGYFVRNKKNKTGRGLDVGLRRVSHPGRRNDGQKKKGVLSRNTCHLEETCQWWAERGLGDLHTRALRARQITGAMILLHQAKE